MFIISKKWIHQYASNPELGMGWTKRQLKAIGIHGKLRKGWIDSVEGMAISDSQRTIFETIGLFKQSKYLSGVTELDREFKQICQ